MGIIKMIKSMFLIFQEAEHEIAEGTLHIQHHSYFPSSQRNSISNSTPLHGNSSHPLSHSQQSVSSDGSSHLDIQESMYPVDGLHTRPFCHFFFHAIPLVVNPVIILRVLCHKVFGNMLRRKQSTVPSSHQKLSPPPSYHNLSDTCPPRGSLGEQSEPSRHGSHCSDEPSNTSLGIIASRSKSTKHVHIATPIETGEDDEIMRVRKQKKRASSMDKGLLKYRRRIGGSGHNIFMYNAIKSIGDSLIQPLDLNINSSPKLSDIEYCSDGIIEPDKGKSVFRFPSMKKQHKATKGSHTESVGSFESIGVHSVRNSLQSLNRQGNSVVKEFEKELINLPVFEIDTHRMDQSTSPLLSRSNSVPDFDQIHSIKSLTQNIPNVGQIYTSSLKERHKLHAIDSIDEVEVKTNSKKHKHDKKNVDMMSSDKYVAESSSDSAPLLKHLPDNYQSVSRSDATAVKQTVKHILSKIDRTCKPKEKTEHISAPKTCTHQYGDSLADNAEASIKSVPTITSFQRTHLLNGKKNSTGTLGLKVLDEKSDSHSEINVKETSDECGKERMKRSSEGNNSEIENYKLKLSPSAPTLGLCDISHPFNSIMSQQNNNLLNINDSPTQPAIEVHFAAATPCQSPSPSTNSTSTNIICDNFQPTAAMLPILSENQSNPNSLSFLQNINASNEFVVPVSTNAMDSKNIHFLEIKTQHGFTSPTLSSPSTGVNSQLLSPSGTIISNPMMTYHSNEMRSPVSYSIAPNSPFSGEVPIQHQGVMRVIETWIGVCPLDLEVGSNTRKEMRDFLNKMSSLGSIYKSWTMALHDKLKLEVSILRIRLI